jgi:purine nucleosidase
MARRVILDVDPGVDDAMAICLALADPGLEVVAVTAGGGNVAPGQATRNVQAVIEQLDPSRWPRMGSASSDQVLRVDAGYFYGVDGFCGVDFPVAELHHRHPSVKVIYDEVTTAPEEVTIIATAPLTNIAATLKRDPNIASQIGHLIVLGGTLGGPGNVTPAAEFNVYCDAESARQVFRSPVTKTVIPIDVSGKVVFDYDLMNRLPGGASRTGALLRQMLPGAFLAHRQRMGLEGIYVHDVVAVVAALQPELFTTRMLHGDVETEGELTHGVTVFDQRHRPEEQPNMAVAVDVDAAGVVDCILRILDRAG